MADDVIPNDPPVLSNIQAAAAQTSATITWDTNEASDSRVRWGTSVGVYPNDSGVTQTNVTRHSVTLSSLTAATTYHYVVLSSDGVNTATTSANLSFQTTTPDTQAPVISGVVANNVTLTSATITWTTNEASSSQVDCGLSTAYESTATSPGMVTVHSVALSGLTSGTTYNYRVQSADAASNLATSANFTFTTLADTTPPTMSGVAATNVTSTAATIVWTTNEASTTQVEYGLPTAYGSSTTLNSQLVTAHSAALSGLSASTTYNYRVKSTDAGGNPGVSGNFTFTTSPAGPVITRASQQWNADCSVQPGDACDATQFSTCAPDDDYRGEHVNDVVVTTTTPRLGSQVTVSCHMGDFGDTDRDVWELWYHDGNGWVMKANLLDADGCGQGVSNCVWSNTLTITGRTGAQAIRCINHYYTSTSSNACRTDSAYDVDEIRLTVNP